MQLGLKDSWVARHGLTVAGMGIAGMVAFFTLQGDVRVQAQSLTALAASDKKQDETLTTVVSVLDRVVAIQEANMRAVEDAGERIESQLSSIDDKVDSLSHRVARIEAQQGR